MYIFAEFQLQALLLDPTTLETQPMFDQTWVRDLEADFEAVASDEEVEVPGAAGRKKKVTKGTYKAGLVIV